MADAFRQAAYWRREYDRPARLDRIRLKRRARRNLKRENTTRLDKDADWGTPLHYFHP